MTRCAFNLQGLRKEAGLSEQVREYLWPNAVALVALYTTKVWEYPSEYHVGLGSLSLNSAFGQ